MTPEGRLLRAVERRLKQIAASDPTFTFRKRHGTPLGVSGDPDLYGLWRGAHWEIELKVPSKSPTLLQQFRLSQWAQAGARTFVVHSLPELEAAIGRLRPVV